MRHFVLEMGRLQTLSRIKLISVFNIFMTYQMLRFIVGRRRFLHDLSFRVFYFSTFDLSTFDESFSV